MVYCNYRFQYRRFAYLLLDHNLLGMSPKGRYMVHLLRIFYFGGLMLKGAKTTLESHLDIALETEFQNNI